MSQKERFGTLVWNALIDLTAGQIEGYDIWASAASVGENANVSTVTARKYLEVLASEGHCEKKTFMGMSGYRVNGGIDPRG